MVRQLRHASGVSLRPYLCPYVSQSPLANPEKLADTQSHHPRSRSQTYTSTMRCETHTRGAANMLASNPLSYRFLATFHENFLRDLVELQIQNNRAFRSVNCGANACIG